MERPAWRSRVAAALAALLVVAFVAPDLSTLGQLVSVWPLPWPGRSLGQEHEQGEHHHRVKAPSPEAGLPDDPQELWRQWLEDPPQQAVDLLAGLQQRADEVASRLPDPDTLAVKGVVDVVCSGGGNLDGYFLGAWMIFSRLMQRSPGNFTMERYNGASAGGQAPFELALKGERITLLHHLSYGLIEEAYPWHFALSVSAVLVQQTSWTIMADWQVQKWQSVLPSMDGRIFLTLTCLTPLPRNVTVSDYTSIPLLQASRAFQATGSIAIWYKGILCSDGGAVSGPDMTPLFKDHLRPQIVVKLLGMGTAQEAIKEDSKQVVRLVQKGQDDALEFLQSGRTASGGLVFCPSSADTSGNVCKP